ncbi:MAG: hypothetical protein IPM50_01460 [Acidobacteriota bacterium]|nr:MAG: hypothetical protein IPM50_01460 [Acidobacteriota bacterium]
MKKTLDKTELSRVLTSTGFLFGLFVLFLNDFFLKSAFGTSLTGKLSDFAGMFVFPLFLAALVPRRAPSMCFAAALAFVFWKSPFSNFAVDVLNSVSPLAIGRIIDYSDWMAVTILPVSYCYFRSLTKIPRMRYRTDPLATMAVLLLSVFVFTATTLTKDRSIRLESSYVIKETHEEFQWGLRQSRSISRVEVRRDDEVFANVPNATIDRKTYFFDVVVKKPTCDSKSTLVSFLIEDEDGTSLLRGISAEFECRAYETAEDYNELNKRFTEHIEALFTEEILSRASVLTTR